MRLRPSARPRPTRYAQATDHAHAMQALCHTGTATCAAGPRCLEHSTAITPDMDLHLAHDPTTGIALGLGHTRCVTG